MCQAVCMVQMQGLSQDLETQCPKLVVVKVFGRPTFQGRPPYLQISTMNMYLLIEIRHDILIQCHENYIEVENLQLYA